METKHTPGPWHTEQSGRIVHIKGEDGFYPATVAHDCGEPVSQANARLIAAAPELLALVDEAQKFCPVHLQDRIRAAISKATA